MRCQSYQGAVSTARQSGYAPAISNPSQSYMTSEVSSYVMLSAAKNLSVFSALGGVEEGFFAALSMTCLKVFGTYL